MTINRMKLTIITFFAFIMIAVTTMIAFAAKNQPVTPASTKETEPEQDFTQHIEDIPQTHFNHSDNTNTAKQILPEAKLRELEGPINKEYGIREDILRFIEREIPVENEKGKHAAIRYAQESDYIYYHANQNEALKAITRKIIALDCLSYFLKDDEWLKISRGISKLMCDTKERDEHMWDIDKRYFGWKVLGNGGLSTKQIEELCESGKF